MPDQARATPGAARTAHDDEARRGPGRPDEVVHVQLRRLDGLLAQVEQIPGPAGALALDAVSALAELYGEALGRVVARTAENPRLRAAITGDELLGHLLVLHGIHPDPVEHRIESALAGLRPAVRQRGGEVELVGIDDGVARVRLTLSGCASSGAAVGDAVRDTVLAVAPELSDVAWEKPAGRPATFVPVESLMQRPAPSGAAP